MHLVSSEIEAYCNTHSSPVSDICRELERYTQQNIAYPQMLIGEGIASFLQFFIRSSQVKNILEIGCFSGYSALAMAEALPPEGSLITLDSDEENPSIARTFWEKSEHGSKIEFIYGEAKASLEKLSQKKFDLVFIDADKVSYRHYLDKTLPLLSTNGTIIADNCLWSGRVLDAKDEDEETISLRDFNDHLVSRDDLYKILLPLRDGLMLIRKK